MSRLELVALAAALCLLPTGARAYPGGTPEFVTDVAPFCAGCHSSATDGQLPGVKPERAAAELAETKHLAKVLAGKTGTPYADLSEEQRKALADGIRAIDKAAQVVVHAPGQVAAGEEFDVTVIATGGGGPVVGIALVDAPYRWQARPAAAAGWQVVDSPRVVGPKGEPQTQFTAKREGAPGISYVNVYDVESDPTAGRWSESKVTFRLRAPAKAGAYPLAAAFLYGTEKGAPHGAVKTAWGGVAPVGGYTANSGRVRFSTPLEIQVR